MENEIKELNETVKEIGQQLDKANLDRAEEIQNMGESSKAMEAKVEDLTKAQKEATEKAAEAEKRADDIEGRINAFNAAEGSEKDSIGGQLIKSEAFKKSLESGAVNFSMNVKGMSPGASKTVSTLATGSQGTLIIEQRVPGIFHTPDELTDVRQILPSIPVNSHAVEVAKETTALADAGVQEDDAAAPVAKQEGTHVTTVEIFNTQTIAQILPVSRQALDDLPQLEAFVNQRLIRSLINKENDELLNGSGTLTGLNNVVGINTEAPLSGTKIDIVLDAIAQCREDNAIPQWIILSPADWALILKEKDGELRHLLSGVTMQNGQAVVPLWGLRVLLNSKMAASTAMVLDVNAVSILDRQQSSIRVSEENSDNFEKNIVSIRAEERLGLADYVATSLCKITFP